MNMERDAWEIERDARTLCEASAIMSDKSRLASARAFAKKKAKEAKEESLRYEAIAEGGKVYKTHKQYGTYANPRALVGVPDVFKS